MKKLTLLIVLYIAMAGAFAQQLIIDTVYFQFDRYDITESYKAEIDSLIGTFTQYPSFFVQIYGHTDSIGSPEYNLLLSEARAKEIALYMRDQGVHLSRIEYAGLGTSKPVTANDTYAGRRKNRRADIAIVFSNEPFVQEEPEVVDSSTIVVTEPEDTGPKFITDTIYCDYSPFLIDPSHQSVIIAPEGTKIVVPPDAFNTESEKITFELKELFFRKDMIMNAMPTVSKEGPLEASGMFMFNATDGRRPASIKPGVKFAAELPSTRRDPNMAIYSGSGGNRGGRRNRGRRGQESNDEPTVGFNAVQSWSEQKDTEVGYKGRDKAYNFEVEKPGRYTVARPLYYSQNTDPEDNGMDIYVKLKGRRYESNTTAMVVGEVVKTYIPLKKRDKRKYEALRVKFLDAKTELIMVAIQYDELGNPWIAKRTFQPGQLIKQRRRDTKQNSRSRPPIKMKVKFRKVTKERLNELLTDLNA
jgi:hypothetical protein